MFPTNYKHAAAAAGAAADTSTPEDCFAEKAARWIYVFAFVVALLLAVGIHRFFVQVRRMPPGQRGLMGAVAWTTAYSPGAGAAVAQGLTIPELALEATSAPDGQGVAVIAVYAGGRAEAAGLRELDQIVRFNGRKVKNPAQFQDIVSRARPEADVKVVILRDGVLGETLIRIGEGEFQPPPVQPPPQPPVAMTL